MRILFTALALTLALGAAFAAAPTGDTVNTKCPVSGEPVKEGVVVSTDKGDIGVCCNKCKAAVEKWDDAKKAKYVASAVASQDSDDAKADKKATDDGKWKGEPYLLDVCAASGRPLDVKGTRTTKVIEGRELKFCCGGCASAVAKDTAKWFPKIDEKIKASQVALYPTEKCVVSGEPLMEDGEDVATSVVVGNRLFRVCCDMCVKKVKADPAKYAAKLDTLAMAAQLKDYPLKACVVNPNAEVDEDSKKLMIGGRLVQVCCKKCARKVMSDPAKYVAQVDAARAKKGKGKHKGDAKGEHKGSEKGSGKGEHGKG